jgi:hypothetical protein
MMGIKKQIRPDYLDAENTIFINKLNFVAANYETTHQIAANLKQIVTKDHRNQLDDLEMKLRDAKEEAKF